MVRVFFFGVIDNLKNKILLESALDLLQAQEKIKTGPEANGKRDTLASVKKRTREENGTRYCKYCGSAHKPQSEFANAQSSCAKRFKLDSIINSCPRSIEDYVETIVTYSGAANQNNPSANNIMLSMSGSMDSDTSQFFSEEDKPGDSKNSPAASSGSNNASNADDSSSGGNNNNGSSSSSGGIGGANSGNGGSSSSSCCSSSCSSGGRSNVKTGEKFSPDYAKAVNSCHLAFKEECLLVRKLVNQMGLLKQDKPVSPGGSNEEIQSPSSSVAKNAAVNSILVAQQQDEKKAAPENISVEQKATEIALLKVLKCFLKSLVKESTAIFQEQKKQDNEQEQKDKVLVPFHVYFAILKNPDLYDFLTNNFKTLIEDENQDKQSEPEESAPQENEFLMMHHREEQDEMDAESFPIYF